MAKKKHKLEVVSDNVDDYNAFSSKDFSPHHLVSLKPKTQPQQDFLRAYFQDIPIILQVGSSGTGKTAMALYGALSEVTSKQTPYEKIILVRSAVQSREIGHMPGDTEDKLAHYESPYISLCDELLSFKSNNYENLKAKHMLEFHCTSFLRGTTWDNAVVIVDEFQSMTYHEISTAVTRLGVNSKMVLCGDMKQNDLSKRNDQSGFNDFMKVVDKMPDSMVEVITYRPEDIIRSDLVKAFLTAEEQVWI